MSGARATHHRDETYTTGLPPPWSSAVSRLPSAASLAPVRSVARSWAPAPAPARHAMLAACSGADALDIEVSKRVIGVARRKAVERLP